LLDVVFLVEVVGLYIEVEELFFVVDKVVGFMVDDAPEHEKMVEVSVAVMVGHVVAEVVLIVEVDFEVEVDLEVD